MTLNSYFSKIFVINLERRTDRWAHVESECVKHNLTVERFPGYDLKTIGGGNAGCNLSHRAVLDWIAYNKWPRVLILEDDFEFVVPDANATFASMIGEVPDDWEWLYLGGSYANDPKYRHSPHVIRVNAMQTTSSYAVTWETAAKVAPHIGGSAGIDTQYHGFTEAMRAFCFDPRLCVQYENMSDIQCRVMNNAISMLDAGHIDRLDGKR